MSTLKLVISDLHLSDGHAVLDFWGDAQQSALDGFLQAAGPTGPLGRADDVELIINGDCFDFLTTSPYDTHGVTNVALALSKLEKIIAAHGPFFKTLRRFLDVSSRHITFITGNHDIELRFQEVAERICQEITGDQRSPRVFFCPTRFYRPLPDVYIEHGNHYDFWNHRIAGLWNEQGEPLFPNPTSIQLPVGSHYFQHAAHPVSISHPYFDHFEPSMNSQRQIALLCLLNPDIVIETAHRTMELFSQPIEELEHQVSGDERVPAMLFEHAILDFAAFQQDMLHSKTDWVVPQDQDNGQAQAAALTAFMLLREALILPEAQAVATIFVPVTYQMGEGVAVGMQTILERDPTLRYAIAGHTHMLRIDPSKDGSQVYLNPASWTARLAQPAPESITPELIEWLRRPNWQNNPLRDVTQFMFVLINADTNGPTNASLCAWEGGANGHYKVVAERA